MLGKLVTSTRPNNTTTIHVTHLNDKLSLTETITTSIHTQQTIERDITSALTQNRCIQIALLSVLMEWNGSDSAIRAVVDCVCYHSNGLASGRPDRGNESRWVSVALNCVPFTQPASYKRHFDVAKQSCDWISSSSFFSGRCSPSSQFMHFSPRKSCQVVKIQLKRVKENNFAEKTTHRLTHTPVADDG